MSTASRCDRLSRHSVRSSPQQSGHPPPCKILAGRSSVGKVNDELVAILSRDCLGTQLGPFSGGVVAEHLPIVATHDPVVKTVVRNNVNSGASHRLKLLAQRDDCQRIGDIAVTGINFQNPSINSPHSRPWTSLIPTTRRPRFPAFFCVL